MTFPPHLLSHPDTQLYKEDVSAPGTDVHYGRDVAGGFVFRLETIAGEIDGRLLAELIDFMGRVEEDRRRRMRIRLLSDEE